jgi:hypothetical protein
MANETYAGGQSVSLAVSAHDNDADTLSYSVTGLPSGLAINAATGLISGTIASAAVSSIPYNILVQIADGVGNIATVAFTITVLADTVTFDPHPTVYTGYVLDKDGKVADPPNPPLVTATFSDPTLIAVTDFRATGPGADTITLGPIKTQFRNQVVFFVYGAKATAVQATAFGGLVPKDPAVLEAQDSSSGNQSMGSVQVVVVVPAAVKKTKHPEVKAGKVAAQNLVLRSYTSPAFFTRDTKKAQLGTAYLFYLKVQVVDQFGNQLNDVYVGAAVSETAADMTGDYPINQAIVAGGTYTDPVGPYQPTKEFADATKGDAPKEIKNWPRDPAVKVPANDITQNIPVQVGGHPLNPAVKNRRVKWTDDGVTTIEWPDY